MAFDRNDPAYSAYIRILEAELIPATGCTEPIAIAYGAASAGWSAAGTSSRT